MFGESIFEQMRIGSSSVSVCSDTHYIFRYFYGSKGSRGIAK